MTRRIIVDIDNTLWDFAPAFYDMLRKLIPDTPPPSDWRGPFWRDYITDDEFRDSLTELHLLQDTFRPFPDAAPFLEGVRGMGMTITIASHRAEKTRAVTEKWLKENELVFDELHLSYDKTVLFPFSWGLVDDAPTLLNKAAKAGLVRAGLLAPWNEGLDHPLFRSLTDVLGYLRATANGVSGENL